MLDVEIFTLFPGMFESPLRESILGRALARGLLRIRLHNIRDYATDRHQVTDDTPYGGGGGMVMKPEPIFAAVEAALGDPPRLPVILLSPQGGLFTQERAWQLAQAPGFALLCGRYEGVDERVREHLATEELSVGDYVLSGGELAAMVVVEAVSRLLPGAIGDEDGALDDSLSSGLLEYPHYTRPADYRGWRVPEVLASGHHAEIARWRREQALYRTWQRRPDLLAKAALTPRERALVDEWQAQHNAHEKPTENGDDNPLA
ncbi:MAG TPA: tRNA (guanosine(37)-N1)-methyltransferase TrmD [Anaerolineales bacterium]|nr:tRNA (guanosine(37)-N1)-methyltransferase TrmD [Anaerolineales bacterium]